MRFDVVALFPGIVEAVASEGILGRAREKGKVQVCCANPRDFTEDPHRTVDDRPYGGGPGMVMRYEPLARAHDSARQANPEARTIALTPQGIPFTQALAREAAQGKGLILIAGRYEGIDERFLKRRVDAEWSVGDYVLSGGELAAAVVIDAVARLLPGVLGCADSAGQDSFSKGLLDCPHYTRPEEIDGLRAPEVLLSGDHGKIARWRRREMLGRTYRRRPDLFDRTALSAEDQALLDEYLDSTSEETDRERDN